MKIIRSAAIGIILAAASLSASAQVASNVDSRNTNTTGSTSASQASPYQSLGLNYNPVYNTDQSGTLRNTPGSVMGAFSGSFSADYCNGTAQVTGSGPGLSLGFGGPVKDLDCVAFRGVERTMQVSSTIRQFAPLDSKRLDQAAIDMLCSVDKIAPALRAQQLCTLPDTTASASASSTVARRREAALYSGS